jgi:hypothetical protein
MVGLGAEEAKMDRDATVASILQRTPVATIEDAVLALSELATALPEDDGVRWFSVLYLAVTQSVSEAVVSNTFRNPEWLRRLDVVFANLFFDALRKFETDRAETPRAWWPLFSCRDQLQRAPVQFALAGINAHINRDLPVAIVKTCEELGVVPARGSAEFADYQAVNPLLSAAEDRTKRELLTGITAVADRVLGRIDDTVAMWSIVEARNAAWTHSEALWALRVSPLLSEQFLDTLDGLVGFASRGLLIAV